ncbi:MAG: DUF721 domain-containing protein [Planctomycetota bacterium]|nr:MAG: DUF721 domain-containing protein [Planctomycetota bacterium]
MAVENRQPKGIYGRQTQRKGAETERLGEVVEQVIEREVLPRRVRFGQLAEAWSGLLPAELRRHCRIADVSGGQIKVLADSPSYVYELRLCGSELIERLQQQCPRFRIKRIKFAVG